MNVKKTNLIAGIFILFLAVVIIGTSVAIYNTPSEVVAGTAGNYTINLTNGGKILEDEGFLLYSLPNKKGIYRAKTDNTAEKKKITDIGDGFLQVIDNTYFFVDSNRLVGCDWNGERQKVIVDYAEKPLVVGSLIFYLDEKGNLKKYSIQNDTTSTVIDSAKNKVQEFVVYYKRIYYTDDSGNIRKTSFDGSNDELFITANASKLSIDGQYIFYIDNGFVHSAMLKDNEILKAKIVKADEYAVFGSTMVYTADSKVMFADINELISNEKKTKVIYDGKAGSISIDKDSFYFFTDKGELKRISHEGKNLKTL